MNVYDGIADHQMVLDVFGQWPSFHDGEVHRVVLDRTCRLANGCYYSSIELHIRGWILTSTETGHYQQKNDSMVHFRFEQITELELDGLNHQNVLASLNFAITNDTKSSQPALFVELVHCYGLSGSFKALKASVVSVLPYIA